MSCAPLVSSSTVKPPSQSCFMSGSALGWSNGTYSFATSEDLHQLVNERIMVYKPGRQGSQPEVRRVLRT